MKTKLLIILTFILSASSTFGAETKQTRISADWIHLDDLNNSRGENSKGIYATTNERGTDFVLEQVAKNTWESSDSVYLGVSGLYNLSLIHASKSRYAILLDFSKPQVEFSKFLIQVLQAANDRLEALTMIKEYVIRSGRFIPSSVFEEAYGIKLQAGWGDDYRQRAAEEIDYLALLSDYVFSSDEKYAYVATMARDGRIKTLHADLTDRFTMKELSGRVRKAGFYFSLLYISNVHDFLDSDDEALYYFPQALEFLTKDKRSLVVDGASDYSFWGFTQRLFFAQDPISGFRYDPDWVHVRKEELPKIYPSAAYARKTH